MSDFKRLKLYSCLVTVYGKTLSGKTFIVFKIFVNFFIWIVTLLIGNVSLQAYHCEKFPVYKNFRSKWESFPLWRFAVYGVTYLHWCFEIYVRYSSQSSLHTHVLYLQILFKILVKVFACGIWVTESPI